MTLYGVFTIHLPPNVPSRCLLLELLDVSVSELLLYSSHQGCSMWMIQHCARDVLEALAFLHHEGYVHADLKPRNILWSAENECFKLIDFGLSFKEGNQVRFLSSPLWFKLWWSKPNVFNNNGSLETRRTLAKYHGASKRKIKRISVMLCETRT